MALPRKTARTPEYPALSAITAAVLCACGGQQAVESESDSASGGEAVGTGGTRPLASGGNYGVTWGTSPTPYLRGGTAAVGDGGAPLGAGGGIGVGNATGVGGALATGGKSSTTAGGAATGGRSSMGGYGYAYGAGVPSFVRGGASSGGTSSGGVAGNGTSPIDSTGGVTLGAGGKSATGGYGYSYGAAAPGYFFGGAGSGGAAGNGDAPAGAAGDSTVAGNAGTVGRVP